MSMQFSEFLARVIDEGIEAATESYGGDRNKRDKLKGSIAGFESCRGMGPVELISHLQRARTAQGRAHGNATYHRDGWSWYWWVACYANEVEWVCNVVSAALYNQGMPVIITPTSRGVLKAASILGTKTGEEAVN